MNDLVCFYIKTGHSQLPRLIKFYKTNPRGRIFLLYGNRNFWRKEFFLRKVKVLKLNLSGFVSATGSIEILKAHR